MVGARRAAVAAAGMEMAEQPARFADASGRVFLLDVHLKSVEVLLSAGLPTSWIICKP
jgi:hypothetical protein